MVHVARGHKKRTSLKRRRQQSGTVETSRTIVKNGIYGRSVTRETCDDIQFGTTRRNDETTIETEDVFTIHAAGEGLIVRMRGCNESTWRKRQGQLDRHCPGWSFRKKDGIYYLDGVDGFNPAWIIRERSLVASKQSGNSHHTQPVPRALPEYRKKELQDADVPSFYRQQSAKRVNTGSKPSRERRVDDLPTINELDRCEARTDNIETFTMPIGGQKEIERKLRSLEDVHQTHIDNLK